ncbi:MAG: nucleoside deaminase [Actinomycetota bacterium]|nr:nucleoside deaminase [Actinomycetota bacterium]
MTLHSGYEPAMLTALELAARAPSWGDVPVGAVVLDAGGAVLSAAANERELRSDPTAHAEILALRAAARIGRSWRLTGATLVVTLEPCTMCAGAAVLARVSRIVFGARDPKAGATGSLWDVARDRRLNHRPEVLGGLRAEESTRLLAAFFAEHRPDP